MLNVNWRSQPLVAFDKSGQLAALVEFMLKVETVWVRIPASNRVDARLIVCMKQKCITGRG